MTDVFIANPKNRAKEGSSFNVVAYFRDGDSSDTPTTAQYRVDCLTTGTALKEWTDLTPASSITIPIAATVNSIQNQSNKNERKVITVQANQGLDGQTRDTSVYHVDNIMGVS